MSNATNTTIDSIATILCQATRHVLESGTRQPVKYSTTFQEIPKVTMKPDIGCFVPFTGDYNGLAVMNFNEDAAMELYRCYMTAMGIPEEELAKDYTSVEVTDSIGEMANQIMGLLMRSVEDKYQLSSVCSQPKALALNSSITLIIDCDYRVNRRMVFNVNAKKFSMEIAMENTEFIKTA